MNARAARGEQILLQLDPDSIGQMIDALRDIAPDMPRVITEFAFGEIYARPGLDLKSRQLATVAALSVLGAGVQLKPHLRAAVKVGWQRQELVEVLMQMALYGGFPAALSALAAAKQTFAELDGSAASP
jgi:4-carboxymuconolactone decarboxylase